MSYFTTREAMTTAEPPELLIFQHSEIIFFNNFFGRLSARWRGIFVYSVYSVDK